MTFYPKVHLAKKLKRQALTKMPSRGLSLRLAFRFADPS
jgi:hypothetical protein